MFSNVLARVHGSPPCTSRYSSFSALLSLRRRLRPFGNPTRHVRYEVKPWTAGETTHSHHAVRDAAVSVARDPCATAPVLEKPGILPPRLPDDGEPPLPQAKLRLGTSPSAAFSAHPSRPVRTGALARSRWWGRANPSFTILRLGVLRLGSCAVSWQLRQVAWFVWRDWILGPLVGYWVNVVGDVKRSGIYFQSSYAVPDTSWLGMLALDIILSMPVWILTLLAPVTGEFCCSPGIHSGGIAPHSRSACRRQMPLSADIINLCTISRDRFISTPSHEFVSCRAFTMEFNGMHFYIV